MWKPAQVHINGHAEQMQRIADNRGEKLRNIKYPKRMLKKLDKKTLEAAIIVDQWLRNM